MASIIKVDNVQNQPGTNVVNKCGTTVNIGAASDNIRSAGNNLQAADGGNLISQSGTDITLGASGDTINLASGASQSGFGRTGTVDWVTTVKVTGDSPITAVTGEGYFLNTTAGTITVNLPAGAAGSIVSMADYAATWQTNNVTVSPNGAEKIGGIAAATALNTEGQSVTFVYIDGTQGWVNTMDSTSNVRGNPYMIATGGTPSTGAICGNCKIHTFTGPGTFTVSQTAACAAHNNVGYLVVAGGGAGGSGYGGGGGAGGFREGRCNPVTPYTASPLVTTGITATASPYPITVGGGGASSGNNGNLSTFDSITSAGGGAGRFGNSTPCVGSGGSGGGGDGGGCGAAGTGNTPPVSPAQGTAGGSSGGTATPNYGRAGGGGATDAGTVGTNTGGGPGGDGATTHTSGTPTTYAGGGGGGHYNGPAPIGAGGPGGGGDSAAGNDPAPLGPGNTGQAGTCNTGGGGGGGSFYTPSIDGAGGAGGSGVVIIRYKFQ